MLENLRDLTPPRNNKENIKEQRTKINLSFLNLAVLFKSLSKDATSFTNFFVVVGALLKLLIVQSSEKFYFNITSVKVNWTIFLKKKYVLVFAELCMLLFFVSVKINLVWIDPFDELISIRQQS